MPHSIEVMRGVVREGNPHAKELIRKANSYLRDCFEAQSPPHVSELAHKMGVAPSTLTRRFRSGVGVNPAAYFKDQQVKCAKRLLLRQRYSVSEIADRAGFGTRRTFFRAFRQRTGVTPDQYRTAALRAT